MLKPLVLISHCVRVIGKPSAMTCLCSGECKNSSPIVHCPVQTRRSENFLAVMRKLNLLKCITSDGPNNLEIVDDVMIPAGLAAGEYVLSWRYDTESTSQVWWVRLLLCTPFLPLHASLRSPRLRRWCIAS